MNMCINKKISHFFSGFLLSVFIAVCAVSCGNIGLGSSVDTQAPVVKITSHNDNDSVSEKFIIRGTAFDNDKVTKLTVDFDDADIHFQIIPGEFWQKKTSALPDWTNVEDSEVFFCRKVSGLWEWSIEVDTAEKVSSKAGNTYVFTAIVEDSLGNSSKDSKVECSLIIDTTNPSVSIYKPELYTGTYTSVKTKADKLALKNGNDISRLMNGEITISGRQTDALSFKELKIEFDNGKAESGLRKIPSSGVMPGINSADQILELDAAKFGDEATRTVYYSKSLYGADLRDWTITVKPEEWITSSTGIEYGLNKDSHIIRVVTTSLSMANAWERKIIGYFVLCPEADKPWFTIAAGDTDYKTTDAFECYPGSNISGSVQDDDGIASLVSHLYVRDNNGNYVEYTTSDFENPKTHQLASDQTKYTAWSVPVPAENGEYKLDLTVTDIYGVTESTTRYFKTSDVSAPKISITAPTDYSSVIKNAEGNITFQGTVKDDGRIVKLAMVWLNPALRNVPANKIKYMTGTDVEWDNALPNGYTDSAGNKIYKFEVGDTREYTINKTFNLYSDFNIGGKDRNNNTIPLSSQDFIFRATDGVSNTVQMITLTGDTDTPDIAFTNIKLNGKTESLLSGSMPTFPKIKNGDTAVITGTWSDKFNSSINNTSKFYDMEITWGSDQNKQTAKAVRNTSNNTWSCTIVAPQTGGTITAQLKDFGGNTKTIQSAASIEKDDLGLARIGCTNDDGSYKAGDTINITLEFTKGTNVTGQPKLKLNNGGTAEYVSGSGSSTHLYKYVVQNTDTDINKLSVTSIVANGVKWSDAVVTDAADLTSIVNIGNLPSGTNLADTRTITVDKTPPRIESITVLSSDGDYKENTSILLMMEFTEDVLIENGSNLGVKFTNGVSTTVASESGTKYVLMTYKVNEGENTNKLTYSSVIHSGVSVKDNAGNSLTNWEPIAKLFGNIAVDTTVPAAPVFKDGKNSANNWNPSGVIFDADGTSFIINGESGASVEYSLDNGANWLPYTQKVSIVNNGTYTVKARQTDKAGNVSEDSVAKEIIVDKGDLFTRITADTVNGTYSTQTDTKKVTGRLEFRKEITLPKDSTVTLNVKDKNNNAYVVPIKECVSAAATKSLYTFEYSIADGDYISNGDYLDVIDFSFSSVSFMGKSIPITVPVFGSGKRFNENRLIKIITGKPKVSGAISFTGTGESAVLSITYDRNITKVSGDVVFEYDTNENPFHVPVVLTADEYNELSSAEIISTWYKPGMNGAKKDGNVLVNETDTKYILDYSKTDVESEIVAAFIAKNKHKVVIPVISDQVSIINGNTLQIRLGKAYELPVKGAVYKLTVPAGVITDEVMNVNAQIIESVTSAGVETPQIRIQKPDYTYTNVGANWTSTANAGVDMTAAQTAKMKIDCRTPGASILYSKNEVSSSAVDVNESIKVFNTKTSAAAIVAPATSYSEEVSLGNDKSVATYAAANGLKIAISASASKNNVTSATGYEYANRTVLKFKIYSKGTSAYDGNTGGSGGGNNVTYIREGENNLIFSQLKMWVIGGDAPYGANTLDPFPLSWADSKNFKLMAGGHNNTDDNVMNGEWWWVTWDVTAPTYHGFAIGDVPSDVAQNGPTKWYVSECAWVATKENYVLYPGETLIMDISDGNRYHSKFMFRLKNEGTR